MIFGCGGVGVGCGADCRRCRRQRFCYCGFAEAGQGGRPFFRSGGAWLIAEGSRRSGRSGAGRGRGREWGVPCGVGVRVQRQGVCCSCTSACGCCSTCTLFQLLGLVGVARVPIFVWVRAGVTHASMIHRDQRPEIRCTLQVCVGRGRIGRDAQAADLKLRARMTEQVTGDLTLDASKSRNQENEGGYGGGGWGGRDGRWQRGGTNKPRERPQARQAPLIQDPRSNKE